MSFETEKKNFKKHGIVIELGGIAGYYNIGYEYIFKKNTRFYASSFVGFSIIPSEKLKAIIMTPFGIESGYNIYKKIDLTAGFYAVPWFNYGAITGENNCTGTINPDCQSEFVMNFSATVGPTFNWTHFSLSPKYVLYYNQVNKYQHWLGLKFKIPI